MSLLVDRRGILSQPIAVAFPTTGLIGRLRGDSIAQADGSAVATWPGLVGGDATQATSGNRPVFRSSGINSKPSVEFSRASLHSLSWGVSAATDPFALLLVFQPTTPAGSAFQAVLGSPGAGAMCAYCRLDSGRLDLEKNNTGTIIQSVDAFCANATKVAALSNYASVGPAGTMWRNGASFTLANLISRALSAGTTTLGVDSQFPGAEYNGQIAEVAKWDHQLDATERAAVFAYTLARYGI